MTYRSFGKKYCLAHYIRFDNLYDYVLTDIKKQIRLALKDREGFIKSLMKQCNNQETLTKNQAEREIKKREHRLEELQKIEKKLYEDSVLGRITEEMFSVLSHDYIVEKKEIKTKLTELYSKTESTKNQEKKILSFTQRIEQYENLEELNAFILNDLIKKIIIHEREIIKGVRTQKIEIEYNFLN